MPITDQITFTRGPEQLTCVRDDVARALARWFPEPDDDQAPKLESLTRRLSEEREATADAAALGLSYTVKRGRGRPAVGSYIIVTRVTSDLAEAVDRAADAAGVPRAEWVRAALEKAARLKRGGRGRK